MSEASGEIWPGCRGLYPYSFSKDILGFLMTTESQDLGLTSYLTLQCPRHCTWALDPHIPQGEPPLLVSLTPLIAVFFQLSIYQKNA